jgi:pyroglutamyl-peptidase
MALDRYSPSAVIALGLDGSARAIEVERMAVNLEHPSMFGFSFVNGSGPLLRHTRLPTSAILAALHDDGVDARRSWFAGLYVCNHVFYRLLGNAARRDVSAGFIHVPPLSSQEPSGMPFDVMLRGIRTAVNVTVAS